MFPYLGVQTMVKHNSSSPLIRPQKSDFLSKSKDRDQLYRASEGGLAATHPEQQTLAVLVAPSVDSEHNTVKAAIIPYACWKVEDLRFEFDSSFVKPEIAGELKDLADLVEDHKKGGQRPPLSLFGHADPVGQDDYNKTLSGRRAEAVYALLTRRVELWEELYTQPFGGDSWQEKKAATTMLLRLGYGDTNEEVRRFQRDQGLVADGIVGPVTRKALYRAYMDAICPVTLDPQQDFIGRGQDPGGKADYQGCGEFNPAMLFSEEEKKEFAKPENREKRNNENAPNRRVMAFLFRPGTRVNPARWPCPRAKEGQADCRKRFWSDGEKRRSERRPRERRKYEETGHTHACRFYDRLADKSPCERLLLGQFRIRLCDPFGRGIPHALYRITSGNQTRRGEADPLGWMVIQDVADRELFTIDWGYPLDRDQLRGEPREDPDEPGRTLHDRDDLRRELTFTMRVYTQISDDDRDQAVFRKLNNVGYPFREGDQESKTAALKRFQLAYAERGLIATGEADELTYEILRQLHDGGELRPCMAGS